MPLPKPDSPTLPLHRLRRIIVSISVATAALSSAQASTEPTSAPASRQHNQEALSCFQPGNCVNSFSSYGLEALVFEGDAEQAMALLLATLNKFPEARIISRAPQYLEVIFTTTIGFEDQVEFRIDAPSRRIDYRSRSKIGLYDFNKNRSRMQDFSARFNSVAVNGEKGRKNTSN